MCECPHENTRVCRFQMANRTWHVCRQCLDCGGKVGTWLSKSTVEFDTLPEFDAVLHESKAAERRAAEAAAAAEQRAAQNGEWRRRYDAYMTSPEWYERRKLVLIRDQGVCQCCRRARAVQVHHLTYDHLGHEPLWELQSICRACHDSLHPQYADIDDDPAMRRGAI